MKSRPLDPNDCAHNRTITFAPHMGAPRDDTPLALQWCRDCGSARRWRPRGPRSRKGWGYWTAPGKSKRGAAGVKERVRQSRQLGLFTALAVAAAGCFFDPGARGDGSPSHKPDRAALVDGGRALVDAGELEGGALVDAGDGAAELEGGALVDAGDGAGELEGGALVDAGDGAGELEGGALWSDDAGELEGGAAELCAGCDLFCCVGAGGPTCQPFPCP